MLSSYGDRSVKKEPRISFFSLLLASRMALVSRWWGELWRSTVIYNQKCILSHSGNHDVRQIAIDAIANTIKYFSEGTYSAEHQLAVPSTVLRDTMHDVGFESIEVAEEGELNPGNIQDVRRFFPSSLCGLEAIYEVLCRKPGAWTNPRRIWRVEQ